MRPRVVITGAGCVSPLGNDLKTVWNHLSEGHSGIGPLTLFDASTYPVRIAAEVKNWNIASVGEDPQRWKAAPRQSQFAIGSGILAMRDAGLEGWGYDPTRLGIYMGCGETYQDFAQFGQMVADSMLADQFHAEIFARQALQMWKPADVLEMELNMPAMHLAAICDAQGPNLNCIAACASATTAIGESAELIRRGAADIMLAGGAHSMIHPFGITGFHRLSTLSQRNDDPTGAERPFDRDRDGFVVGEGGAMVVLESLEHAQRRGANILAELTGYGSAQDAYRVTDTHPEGRGAVAAMHAALDDARINPDQIDYINAHGTGTKVNDSVETVAIKRVFGSQAYRVPISSTKSMLGHFTTASGAIELVVSLLALRHNATPPTINYHTPDPECDLDYVPNIARDLRLQHVMSNSFGFGGQNAVLVVSRYEGSKKAHAGRRAA